MSGKRTTRAMKPEQKAKISAALTGKQKTEQHREHLSQALKKYWEGIPCADGHPINEPSGMFDPTNNTSKPSNHA